MPPRDPFDALANVYLEAKASRRRSKARQSAPVCVFCHRSEGVQFAIFTPRFQPFGTACTECEATLPPDTKVPEVQS